MASLIGAFPNINPSGFFKAGRRFDPILCRENVFLYSSGRAALYRAIRAARLPEKSRILVPSFHCGVEVEAAKRAGHPLSFYGIKKNLEIDFEDAQNRIDPAAGALIVTHYFGFPQNLEKVLDFCGRHKLLLFEDCAHALYSSINGRWLGTAGDFGVYSLRKTMGLPNGGALLCNTRELARPEEGEKSTDFPLLKQTLKSMLMGAAGKRSLAGGVSREMLRFIAKSPGRPEPNASLTLTDSLPSYYDVRDRDFDTAISGLSDFLLRKEDYRDIIGRRRENFRRLGDKLEDSPYFFPPMAGLEKGVCPLCYVVQVDNRAEIAARMRRRGVNPFIFGVSPHPLMPRPIHPDWEFLSQRLLGLPVHQALGLEDMDVVIDEFFRSGRP